MELMPYRSSATPTVPAVRTPRWQRRGERSYVMLQASVLGVTSAALGFCLVLLGAACKPTMQQARAAAVVASYEAALDACIANSKTYAEYSGCADEVDRRYDLPHGKKDDGR